MAITAEDLAAVKSRLALIEATRDESGLFQMPDGALTQLIADQHTLITEVERLQTSGTPKVR